MNFLDRLERRFRRYAIPNVTLYLVIGQVLFYFMDRSGQFDLGRVVLVPELVLAGEYWRLVTFLFIPPFMNLFSALLAWYVFYLMGTALENHWGTFRYNIFLLTGFFATIAASFVPPSYTAMNTYLMGSVFFAFAYLYPDFVFYVLFILPIKVKWIALFFWVSYGLLFITGSTQTRLMVLASIANFLFFFGNDILWKIRTGKRKMAEQAREISGKREAFHRCTVCGKTDLSDPQMEFRYCPDCGGLGYCMEHIMNHEHRKKT